MFKKNPATWHLPQQNKRLKWKYTNERDVEEVGEDAAALPPLHPALSETWLLQLEEVLTQHQAPLYTYLRPS